MLDALKKEGRILRKTRIKEKVIKMIEELPEDITVSDVMAELYFRQNVDEGLMELDEGKGISHEEAKKRLSRWLK
jgi:predicted transcriptional regulator